VAAVKGDYKIVAAAAKSIFKAILKAPWFRRARLNGSGKGKTAMLFAAGATILGECQP
jgi:hypothetical protein